MNTYLLSKDTLNRFFHGFLGATTFGAYNLWNFDKAVENVKIEHRRELKEQEQRHQRQIQEIKDQLNKRWWN